MNTTNFIYELYDADEYEAFIKNCEKTFRNSVEYKKWLLTTKNHFCHLTGKDANSIDIEVHHYDKTLYVIVSDIVDLLIDNQLKLNSFFVCLIVADIHLSGCVDYIPIDIGIHRAIHKDPRQIKEQYQDIEEKVIRGDKEKKNRILSKWVNIMSALQGKSELIQEEFYL